ncbi:DUF3151 domain-containing protein [Corynebacterium suicordis]|uniref:DUF3151 domain-containing protein n=1 Tax=Corynebacterium suicordis DSM 45110 TaxID=1121369 RepID=A0ABR9ZLE2_9CORY|nr:DUF3151 domain-containing protein [Corynebacterium suicordis]MBF4554255.1 DUF3151 domain-containing protein [Corynebacterium suicordis DSM 45110]MDR6276766.1 hypothetical protein [Corynebacterium suicordis]
MSEQLRGGRDLFGAEHPEVRLPDELITAANAEVAGAGIEALEALALNDPKDSGVWAALANRHLDDGDAVTGYACARTGYHRGLDALRANGWRGTGPVPWDHEPNRGVLRAIGALVSAARAVKEEDEEIRCLNLLHDCDPAAAPAMRLLD